MICVKNSDLVMEFDLFGGFTICDFCLDFVHCGNPSSMARRSELFLERRLIGYFDSIRFSTGVVLRLFSSL